MLSFMIHNMCMFLVSHFPAIYTISHWKTFTEQRTEFYLFTKLIFNGWTGERLTRERESKRERKGWEMEWNTQRQRDKMNENAIMRETEQMSEKFRVKERNGEYSSKENIEYYVADKLPYGCDNTWNSVEWTRLKHASTQKLLMVRMIRMNKTSQTTLLLHSIAKIFPKN